MLKTYRMKFLPMMILVLLTVQWSCNKEESIPAMVYLSEFQFTAQDGFGSSSSKVTEYWVYANGQLLGAFPIPGTVPILSEGPTELRIFPGIHDNGILSLASVYPFYEPIIINHDLIPGQTDTLAISTQYLPEDDLEFYILEPFDNNLLFTEDLDTNSLTVLQLTPDGFEGQAGLLEVTDTTPILSVATDIAYALPANGTNLYMEMDYKNDFPFSIWFRGHNSSGQAEILLWSVLNKQTDWNKIYIPLHDLVNQEKWLGYQLILHLEITEDDINEGVTAARALVDNIKLIGFK